MEQSNPLSLSNFPKLLRQRFLSPMRSISQIEDDMQKWLGEVGFLPSEFYNSVDFVPQCDLRETNKEFVARLDIPGVKKDELKIEVDGNRLTIRGERKAEKEEKDERHYFAESTCGSFMRSFTLPTKIEETKVDAHFADGVLTIKIPKTEISKAKEVAIH